MVRERRKEMRLDWGVRKEREKARGGLWDNWSWKSCETLKKIEWVKRNWRGSEKGKEIEWEKWYWKGSEKRRVIEWERRRGLCWKYSEV